MSNQTKLRGEALDKKMKADIEKILNSGLSALERSNESDSSNQTNHLSIIGGVRRVEYYPSTGSAFANAVKGKFKRSRGRGVDDAIRIAKAGR